MKVLGLAGWSGSGKTTLLVKLIPLLVSKGLRIATLKHAHHNFDLDKPDKDSYQHRKAGASEVIISSSRRWVQMHELGAGPEPTLAQLLMRLSACDLALVEGFKSEKHSKIEIFRAVIGKPLLCRNDPHILAVASDHAVGGVKIPVLGLNDTDAIADFIVSQAEPLDRVLLRL